MQQSKLTSEDPKDEYITMKIKQLIGYPYGYTRTIPTDIKSVNPIKEPRRELINHTSEVPIAHTSSYSHTINQGRQKSTSEMIPIKGVTGPQSNSNQSQARRNFFIQGSLTISALHLI